MDQCHRGSPQCAFGPLTTTPKDGPLAQWSGSCTSGQGRERSHEVLPVVFARKTSLKRLVRIVKLRWRIERDYREMKVELGLDHFEGRMWRGRKPL